MRKIMVLFGSLIVFFILNSTLSHAQTFEPEAPASSDQPEKPRSAISRLSEDDREVLENGRISQGRYIAGGVVATVVGLGIGQGIEGRYWPLGFVFSVGEAGSIALIVAGASNCFNQNQLINGANISSCENNTGLVIAGVVGLVGFHIWETIDAWVSPNAINKHYDEVKKRTGLSSAQLLPIPVSNRDGSSISGGELALQFHF